MYNYQKYKINIWAAYLQKGKNDLTYILFKTYKFALVLYDSNTVSMFSLIFWCRYLQSNYRLRLISNCTLNMYMKVYSNLMLLPKRLAVLLDTLLLISSLRL